MCVYNGFIYNNPKLKMVQIFLLAESKQTVA